MIARASGWLEMNQQSLSRAIADVRAALMRHAARPLSGDAPARPPQERPAAGEDRAPIGPVDTSALDDLAAAFGLTSFERDVVVLCAATELDAGVASDCERAQGPQRAYPTFGLALAALSGAHWSAVLPEAPLRHWRLVDFAQGGSPSAPLTSRPLRIDERILHYLTGLTHLDERLAAVSTPVSVEQELVPSHRALADRMTLVWRRGAGPGVLALHGPDPASARAIAAAACQSNGWRLHTLSERLLPSSGSDLQLLVRLWEREFRLDSSALLIDVGDRSADGNRDGAWREFVDRMTTPLFVTSRERLRTGWRPTTSLEVARPTAAEQRAIWVSLLPESRVPADPGLDALVSQFSLGVPEIRSAAAEAGAPQPGTTARALWSVCRQQARGRLDDLAQRIASTCRLDDLVLPDAQKEILEEIVAHVRHRPTVHDAWGFGADGNRGLGVTALFAGASGTGKTMAAEVLAGALELDLYRIDLSSVVSKYIGETEKNLRSIFDAADAGGVVLLFDEADALFGKRSEVKDSHDRYSNIEVSYLLQRMECYRGLAILTTNLKSALDSAFLRRIRFVVQFPFPELEQRAEIWRRVFPRLTPTSGLDAERLAQLCVAGGSIRNVAMRAAFFAAGANEPVGMSHVLRAARSEYTKLEKSLTDAEVAGWTEELAC